THVGRNSPLRAAMGQAPTSLLPTPVQPSEAPHDTHANPLLTPPVLPTSAWDFYRFVAELHAAKHESYGDSWKKRGEQISILANIARKVDRLGVGDQFDSQTDTVVDLLVYSIKYYNWIQLFEDTPKTFNHLF